MIKDKYKVSVLIYGQIFHKLKREYHREDGPAIEYLNGGKHWYLHGKRHREDGPAIEYDHVSYWYLNGRGMSREEYERRVNGQIYS